MSSEYNRLVTYGQAHIGDAGGKRELIDRCPKNHGLWFDRGELQSVLKMGHFDDEGRVRTLLGGIFCSENVE